MNRWHLLALVALGSVGMEVSAAEETRTPFGVGSCHVNGRSVEDYQRWVPQMVELGLKDQRSLMSGWGELERTPGEWHWENMDAQWSYLHERGIETGTLLLGNPAWNQKDPPGHLPVNFIDGWSEYVRQVVRHFRGRIRRYEVWNEPPNFTGPQQTAADYARLVVAAYDAAKAVDPDAQIGLTTKSAHLVYLRQAIEAGAADHFDWISLHPYEVLDGIVADIGMEPIYANLVPSVRRMLAEVNPGRKDVPVVFTELGVDAGRHGEAKQADALVKAYVIGMAQGLENLQWFEGRDGDSGPMGLLDGQGRPRAAYHAYGRLIQALGLHPQPRGWAVLGASTYGWLFECDGKDVVVAWCPRGGREELSFSGEVEFVHARDGREGRASSLVVGTSPVFLSQVPSKDLGRVTAVTEALPPWPGDPGTYHDAQEVKIDYALDPPERGLHSRGGAEVAEAIVNYGGSARAGDAPGGNLLMVDPSFLGDESVPLKITAEVRRKDPAVNAGFKLVYEGPDGFKTAGSWRTIPEEDRWHVIEWSIQDPRFVSFWGYHFRLESDGAEYGQYLLRRLTVSKEASP
ncbi:hypothetical protein HNR46_001797 [Haloferula luteola]|uniref:Glycosyl hydrolases family 39 N-terminal catalytic domain-containing protein n=1 Tax=Haloferula luteola TaxID=595692 RepID=A0A840VCB3_9BACT|nr:hypothetical protein [Haloferula luteola]MBB5351560.1 hypothetical protein [Haloferula luteola]